MKKIYVLLEGGLGNQMFQYATARAMALRTGADLVLDSWSGFVRDYQYRRHYELGGLPIRARVATALERLPIWLYRAENKLRDQSQDIMQRRVYGTFIVETKLRQFIGELVSYRLPTSLWLVGYWQSPLYFQDYAVKLQTELIPAPPVQQRFLDLGKTVRSHESVALGIRLYEESTNPAAHAKDGRLKTVVEVNGAIDRLRAKSPEGRFFVFCTHRSPILEQLNLPSSAVFVTHDDGYEGTLERLWLLSQCRHHIFTNSSYYWWGAWLSNGVYSPHHVPQHIFAADNFVNEDSSCSNWENF
jgi:hypothetical protein